MNPKVDFYFVKNQAWQDEVSHLRTVILDCGLAEELKWGVPCYTLDKRNICLIHDFKEYCAVLFMKGALIQDPQGLLIQQTENVQAARQMRFRNLDEVLALEAALKGFIREAIAIEQSGQKVPMKKATELVYPEEFQRCLDEYPELKTAFLALTPGRQRAYNLYFSAPKQAKTREARIEKSLPRILDGKGLEDA